MHRLASVPGLDEGDASGGQGVPYVEQPPAPVLLLSSADTDLLSLQSLLNLNPELLGAEARALNLAALSHPAVIDHYLATARSCVREHRSVFKIKDYLDLLRFLNGSWARNNARARTKLVEVI